MNKNAQVSDLEEQILMHVAAGLAANPNIKPTGAKRHATVVAERAIEITDELFRLKRS